MAKPKALTREQLQSRKEKAERFTRDVRDDPELAAQIEAESVEDYARHRGIELLNPHERRVSMATVKELNQEIRDLEETINEATAILEDAYTPESSREDLAEAIGNALDVLSGEEEEEEEEEAEEEVRRGLTSARQCRQKWRKPTAEVTAGRYDIEPLRAHPPAGPRICAFCGAR